MTHYDTKSIFDNRKVLCYCENHGIYKVYSRNGNTIVYYSLYSEGFYKITVNVVTGKEKRQLMKWKNIPEFLKSELRYNYCSG